MLEMQFNQPAISEIPQLDSVAKGLSLEYRYRGSERVVEQGEVVRAANEEEKQ